MIRAALCVAVVVPLCACSPAPPDKQAVQKAYRLARESLLADENLEVDVLWILQDILRMEPDRKLQRMVEGRVAMFGSHPYLLMVKPNAPRIELPSDPGRGIDRYFVYIQSAFGFPRDRAVRYLVDFLSKRESGYILTHQLAAVLWAEQTGLELPIDIGAKKQELLAQIHAEQVEQGHGVCVDLYAERLALLLRHGTPSRAEAFDWIGKLVVSQRADGTWPESSAVIEYDGQKASTTFPPSHTTALAMLALKSYLANY